MLSCIKFSHRCGFTLCCVSYLRISDNTYIGTIAHLASGTSHGETTMHREVNRFVKAIGILAVTTATILAIIGFARKEYWVDVLINAFISTIIANVPEV